jgi:hypothetical protein
MAMASVGVVGFAIFYTLYYGLLLYTKNTAMNVSHEEARLALLQLVTDIHAAVSAPSLTDSNGNMISATTASPGVEFQQLISPSMYCQVSGTVGAGQNIVNVGIPSGYPTPYAGLRLIIPAFEIEQNVTAVSMSGTIAACTLANTLSTSINGAAANVMCFFTQRVYYFVNGRPSYVQNGVTVVPPLTLNYLGIGRTATYTIGSEDLSSPTPFSIPNAPSTSGTSNASGTPDYHYVMVTGLSTQDPQTANLNSVFHFSTSSIMISGEIPVYSTLTTYQ